MKFTKLNWLVTPALYAIFPILFLYVHNAQEMKYNDLLWPLIMSSILSVLLTGILRLLIRDNFKTGFLAGIWIILFFSYGHFANIVSDLPDVYSFNLARMSKILIPIFLAVLSAFLVFRIRKNFEYAFKMLAFLGMILVTVQIIQIIVIERTGNTIGNGNRSYTLSSDSGDKIRDIYFIILDGYGRKDVLQDMYGYDNSEFISYLNQKGFHVSDSTHSNYAQTLPVITSIFNMNYIRQLDYFEKTSEDRRPMHEKFVGNSVMKSLKHMGFKIVAYESGYAMTEYRTADFYIVSNRMLNEFSNILLSTTPLPQIFSRLFSPFEVHRNRIRHTLNKLEQTKHKNYPEFHFAHIISPHPPFVFDSIGGAVEMTTSFTMGDGSHYMEAGGDTVTYQNGYLNQLKHISSRITGIIERLLSGPEEKHPIIILMGDHGPGSQLSWVGSAKTNLRERFSILYALYLPGYTGPELGADINPVNTFRIIFNNYYGTNFEMLKSYSYYATWLRPYDMVLINKDSTDDIYEYLLEVYNNLSPHEVEYRHISHPKRQGTPSDSGNCFAMDDSGVTIRLHKILDSQFMEYSIDHNDSYMVYFRMDSTIIASDKITPHEIPGGGLRVEQKRVPDRARNIGFNNLLIIPIAGDGHYSLGHVRFGSMPRR